MKTLDINKLPYSWNQVTLGQFQQLTQIQINEGDFAGIENTLSVISVLTGIPVTELEELAMKELALLGDRISFINTQPEPSKKTSLTKWKDLDSISYNDFIVFMQNQDDVLSNLDVFVKQFSKTELTKEEIQGLPITDVLQGFFLCRKKLRLSMKLLQWSTQLQAKRLKKKERQAMNKT